MKRRTPGHSSVSLPGNAGEQTCNCVGTMHPACGGPGGCSPSPPNTPKHLHLVSPQRGVLQEHPGLAPVPKELTDRHGLGRTEGTEQAGKAV